MRQRMRALWVAAVVAVTGCATVPAPLPKRDVSDLVLLEGDAIVVKENIRFSHGSTEIDPRSTDLLDAVAEIMKKTESIAHLTIIGHTDTTGDPAANPPLSAARALAVKRYLEGRGVAAARLEAKGVGSDQPIDTNQTEEGRARNRRVEFRIVQ
jgi:OmpA-OmpF porin, OOP family